MLNWLNDNLHLIDYSIVYEVVASSLKKFGVPTAILHKGHYIDRVRVNGQFLGEVPLEGFKMFNHKDEINYLKDKNILAKRKDFGRANMPNQSIFYGSIPTTRVELARATAYFESGNNIEKIISTPNYCEIFTMGRWRVKRSILLAEVVFSRDVINVNPDILRAAEHHIQSLNIVDGDKYLQQLIFFSEQFSKKVKSHVEYKMSCAYSNLIWKTMPMVGGISYPSVGSDYLGQNIALLPHFVDNYLELESTGMFIAFKFNNEVIVSPFKISAVDNKTGLFIWKDITSTGIILDNYHPYLPIAESITSYLA